MHLRLFSLLLSAAILTSCDPPDENANDPFAQHNKKLQQMDKQATTFQPPPELAATLGLEKNDTRAEVVFLQSQTIGAFQLYQKSMLTILIGRQSGNRFAPFDASGKAETQARQLREAVQRKAAAIIIDPVEKADLSGPITEAVAAGIPVIGLEKHLQGCTTLVYCDPLAIGQAAGDLAVQALKRKAAEEGKNEPAGRVVQLRGDDDSPWCSDVSAGFGDALKAAPGVVLVHDAPTDWSPENAFQRLVDAIRIQKQFDIVFAHSDTIAQGVAKAANTYHIRENLLIAGVNALPGRDEGMHLLRTGEIDATIGRPPLVDAALEIVMKLRTDAAFKPQAEYRIAPMLITPSNLDKVTGNGFYTLPKL
jgi:ABC-type sugar transport system substrate-binding protein